MQSDKKIWGLHRSKYHTSSMQKGSQKLLLPQHVQQTTPLFSPSHQQLDCCWEEASPDVNHYSVTYGDWGSDMNDAQEFFPRMSKKILVFTHMFVRFCTWNYKNNISLMGSEHPVAGWQTVEVMSRSLKMILKGSKPCCYKADEVSPELKKVKIC